MPEDVGDGALVLIIYCLYTFIAWNENAENASGIIQQTRTKENE
jgi:hypothetical protein